MIDDKWFGNFYIFYMFYVFARHCLGTYIYKENGNSASLFFVYFTPQIRAQLVLLPTSVCPTQLMLT